MPMAPTKATLLSLSLISKLPIFFLMSIPCSITFILISWYTLFISSLAASEGQIT